jgi:hypothetical protein
MLVRVQAVEEAAMEGAESNMWDLEEEVVLVDSLLRRTAYPKPCRRNSPEHIQKRFPNTTPCSVESASVLTLVSRRKLL